MSWEHLFKRTLSNSECMTNNCSNFFRAHVVSGFFWVSYKNHPGLEVCRFECRRTWRSWRVDGFLCQSTQRGHTPIFRVSLRKAFQFRNGKFNSSPPIFFGKKNLTFLSRKMLCLIEIYISNLTPSTSAINFRHGAQRHWSLHPLGYFPAVVQHRSTRRLTVCCKTPQFYGIWPIVSLLQNGRLLILKNKLNTSSDDHRWSIITQNILKNKDKHL